MRNMFLLIPLIANTALAGWFEYPIQVDFGSQQICKTAAENIDNTSGLSSADLSVTCKEGKWSEPSWPIPSFHLSRFKSYGP